MSKEEAKRLTVIGQVLEKKVTQKRAAQLLGLSLPRVKVLCRQVRQEGPQAVVHGNAGKTPAHTVPATIREQVAALYRLQYGDFNFSHFAEKLAEKHAIVLSRSTVYRILREDGLSSNRKKRKARRHYRRKPKERAGELAQLDASKYDWFETGGYCHLHASIDDADSSVLALWFSQEEVTTSYVELVWQMNARGTLPLACYTDRRGVFTNNRPEDRLSIDEQLAGVDPSQTQFSRALGELGIRIILASSPEAKGRVERLWDTLQDRLVKEMRLAGIRTMDEANAWLPTYIADHNKRFARIAEVPEPAYLPKVPVRELELILCQHFPRKLDHGLSFSYNHHTYVLPRQYQGKSLIAHASQTVTVLDSPRFGIKAKLTVAGRVVIVAPCEITRTKKTPQAGLPYTSQQRSENGRIGAANSPWSVFTGPRQAR